MSKIPFFEFCFVLFQFFCIFCKYCNKKQPFSISLSCLNKINSVFSLSAKQFIIGHLVALCSSQFGWRPVSFPLKCSCPAVCNFFCFSSDSDSSYYLPVFFLSELFFVLEVRFLFSIECKVLQEATVLFLFFLELVLF